MIYGEPVIVLPFSFSSRKLNCYCVVLCCAVLCCVVLYAYYIVLYTYCIVHVLHAYCIVHVLYTYCIVHVLYCIVLYTYCIVLYTYCIVLYTYCIVLYTYCIVLYTYCIVLYTYCIVHVFYCTRIVLYCTRIVHVLYCAIFCITSAQSEVICFPFTIICSHSLSSCAYFLKRLPFTSRKLSQWCRSSKAERTLGALINRRFFKFPALEHNQTTFFLIRFPTAHKPSFIDCK